MKTSILSAVMFGVMVITTACSNEDDSLMTGMEKSESREACAPTTTVLVYMAGRNDLSGALMDDLSEIKRGSKNLRQNDNLIVFVRNNHEQQPWVARIKDGLVTDSVSLSDLGIRSSDGENRASDPAVMEGVMHYAFSHYPATSGNYGLVIEGHGCGWLMKQEVSTTMCRAIAVDNGKKKLSSDGRWINIPTMAAILKNMPHLRFIMTDCCNMMCLENLYELRNVCDYMIGSPAEIPAPGAPYDLIVPDMFSQSETFYANITGKYYNSLEGGLPLVAVKTSEMEKVAQATRIALLSVREELAGRYPDMKGIIHYYHTNTGNDFLPEYNIFYDAGDFMQRYAPADVYRQWKQVLNQAIVECHMATFWDTDKNWQMKYADFIVTEEKFHGVSMFVPQDPDKGDYSQYNEDIKQMAWYAATM